MSAVFGAGLSNEFRRALLGGASREVSESNMFCMHVYKMLRFFFFYVIGRATPLPRANRRQHLSSRRQALMGLARLPSVHRLAQLGARLRRDGRLMARPRHAGRLQACSHTDASYGCAHRDADVARSQNAYSRPADDHWCRVFTTSSTVRTAWHRTPSIYTRSWPFGGYRNNHTFSCKRGFLPIAGGQPARFHEISFAMLTIC
jgi:hypothetical protein